MLDLAPPPRPVDPDAKRIGSLTSRERQIVAMLLHSTCSKKFAVAQTLGMSEHALRNHLTTIYTQRGVCGRLAGPAREERFVFQ